MATLAVRSLHPHDVPSLRHVRQLRARLDLPSPTTSQAPEIAQLALAVLPELAQRRRVFVALVDGELCAYLEILADQRRVVWDVRAVAAGSPHLEATDDVSAELWEALLEYAIVRAGAARIRRVFAAVHEGSVAQRSLRAAGFEAYTRLTLVVGRHPQQPVPLPIEMRRQERSDVWAIHQLYHRTTPRIVQFAEARTSATWELRHGRLRSRLPRPRRDREACAFVLETTHGIQGYCRVTRCATANRVEMLADPGLDGIAEFVLAAASQAGVEPEQPLCLVLPGYASERVTELCAAGFEIQDERLAMIRHTTVPAPVRARLTPVPALEVADRAAAPRGIPSYS